ncbi:putative cellobiose dehydrogenase [Rhexocercosporidium sp. MPI-PUGE-AT-0058]|nr:putative cellobiose dehydrogenase [Rhexocercosporidium sp. MPI-PUGE-AT-0058]
MVTLSTTTLLLALHLLTLSKAQTTTPFTDPVTGIQFQRFFGAKTQFAFGIALPENPTTDFIGQMTFPLTASGGWGGISLADDMVGPLLLAAWPDGNTVQSSFRLASTEDASPPVATGSFSVVPIPSGTSVNGTSMSFTFLCKNCIDSKLGFAAGNTLGTFGMGWALAGKPVSDPASAATELSFHDKGFDEFDAQLNAARSPLFGEWALLAGADIVSNGSTTAVAPIAPGSGGGFAGGDDDDDEDEESGEDSDDDDD